MENNFNIDKKFNQAYESNDNQTDFAGFDKVWAKVEEKLDEKDNTKKKIITWWPYGIAASLLIGVGGYYFLDYTKDNPKNNVVISNTKTKNNSKIKVIDSLIIENIKQDEKSTISNEDHSYLVENSQNKKNIDKVSEQNIGVETQNVVANEFNKNNNLKDTISSKNIFRNVEIGTPSSIEKQNLLAGNTVIRMDKKVNYSTQQKSYFNQEFTENYVASNSQGYFNTPIFKNNSVNSLRGDNNAVNIRIRGVSSLNGNNPLYIIDGKIANSKELKSLNPATIKSMEVLKNDKATALYGSAATNGVVIIKTKKLTRKERKAFLKLQKVEDSIKKARKIEQYNNEEYNDFIENPFELTKNQSVSTFSIDVDRAAYSNIRRMINNGEYVDKNAVRIEEMINYFTYSYPKPRADEPFSISTEYNEAPWNHQHKLLKIGLQGKTIPENSLPKSNLVFLIDVSGSMNEANKLPLLKSAFKVLLNQLKSDDRVAIVVYAGNAGLVLPSTQIKEKEKIIEALDRLQAGGSTAGGEGLELAYKIATENFIKKGNNRVVIATDGDFNVGTSSVSDLEKLIEEKRKTGVFLTCLGFGMGNFKDNRMETLANKGNGNYGYIDNLQEANKFLGKEFMGNMFTIAKDVKIQIEFNPEFVKSYRLIGYEDRKLRNEDFTNDKIDAGELGAGHTVTALYEIIPTHVNSRFLPKETELKYTSTISQPIFNNELATIKFRYKNPDQDNSHEIVEVVKNSHNRISKASEDFNFASSVAWFGLVLRNSDLIENKNSNDIKKLAKKGKSHNDTDGYRTEFIRLIEAYQASY